LRNLSKGDYLHFSALLDFCKEMSTKSNDNAAAVRRKSLRSGAFAIQVESAGPRENASDENGARILLAKPVISFWRIRA
jgi:hypothetical protein